MLARRVLSVAILSAMAIPAFAQDVTQDAPPDISGAMQQPSAPAIVTSGATQAPMPVQQAQASLSSANAIAASIAAQGAPAQPGVPAGYVLAPAATQSQGLPGRPSAISPDGYAPAQASDDGMQSRPSALQTAQAAVSGTDGQLIERPNLLSASTPAPAAVATVQPDGSVDRPSLLSTGGAAAPTATPTPSTPSPSLAVAAPTTPSPSVETSTVPAALPAVQTPVQLAQAPNQASPAAPVVVSQPAPPHVVEPNAVVAEASRPVVHAAPDSPREPLPRTPHERVVFASHPNTQYTGSMKSRHISTSGGDIPRIKTPAPMVAQIDSNHLKAAPLKLSTMTKVDNLVVNVAQPTITPVAVASARASVKPIPSVVDMAHVTPNPAAALLPVPMSKPHTLKVDTASVTPNRPAHEIASEPSFFSHMREVVLAAAQLPGKWFHHDDAPVPNKTPVTFNVAGGTLVAVHQPAPAPVHLAPAMPHQQAVNASALLPTSLLTPEVAKATPATTPALSVPLAHTVAPSAATGLQSTSPQIAQVSPVPAAPVAAVAPVAQTHATPLVAMALTQPQVFHAPQAPVHHYHADPMPAAPMPQTLQSPTPADDVASSSDPMAANVEAVLGQVTALERQVANQEAKSSDYAATIAQRNQQIAALHRQLAHEPHVASAAQ